MTRTEALATITATLASLDDARVLAVAAMVADMVEPMQKLRPLRPHEHALLAEARQDFAEGRTATLAQSRARTDALFAQFEATI